MLYGILDQKKFRNGNKNPVIRPGRKTFLSRRDAYNLRI